MNLASFLLELTQMFRARGARHILVSGLALPGKDLDKLIMYNEWAAQNKETELVAYVKGDDPLLRKVAACKGFVRWDLSEPHEDWLEQSQLIKLLAQAGERQSQYQSIAGLHLHVFDVIQIIVCLAGTTLCFTDRELAVLTFQCAAKFMDLQNSLKFQRNRPGSLSARERLVLRLTAEGKTANEIADALDISKRTVHAHLQNASEKLHSANKTQTVIDAIRYGQISSP